MKAVWIASALVASVVAASPALANKTLDAAFANTVVVKNGDATVRVHYNADGTLKTGDGQTGVWRKNGDTTLCHTIGTGPEVCATLYDGKKVGDSWETKTATGETLVVSLEAGR